MVKHSHDFEPGERPELDCYLPGLRPPLEAQLIDLADEVAYNTADLDDAFSAGMVTSWDVAEAVPQYHEIHQAAEMQFPGATPRERFHESLRQLVDTLVTGLIEGTVARARESGARNVSDVRRYARRLAAFTSDTARSSRELKHFLYEKVYASPALRGDRQQSMAMTGELFQFFLAEPARLPEPYCRQALEEPAHRVVCDYIAGMTDAFFRRTYEQMLGPTPPPS
jgi:dGTPase